MFEALTFLQKRIHHAKACDEKLFFSEVCADSLSGK